MVGKHVADGSRSRRKNRVCCNRHFDVLSGGRADLQREIQSHLLALAEFDFVI